MIRWLFLLITLLLLLMAGCMEVSNEGLMTEVPQTAEAVMDAAFPNTLYFPDDENYSFIHDLTEDKLVYPEEIFKTNTTKLRVKNTGSIPVICNVYYPDDPEEIIMTQEIVVGNTVSFSTLISTMYYQLGFECLTPGTMEVLISG